MSPSVTPGAAPAVATAAPSSTIDNKPQHSTNKQTQLANTLLLKWKAKQQAEERLWIILTDALLSQNTNTVLATIKQQLFDNRSLIDTLIYEMFFSVRYYNELRLSNQLFNSLFEVGYDLSESKADYCFDFITHYNNSDPNPTTKRYFADIKKIPQTQKAKYIRNISSLQTDFKLITDLKAFQLKVGAEAEKNLIYQERFWLLHESNEGYSQVITLLGEGIKAKDSSFRVKYTSKALNILTAHYKLDPIRIIDIILDMILHSAADNYRFLFDLFKLSDFWPQIEADNSSLESLNVGGSEIVLKLVVLKMKSFGENDKPMTDFAKLLIPLLIKIGVISFGSVLPYLGPDEATMKKFEDYVQEKIEDELFKATASALALSAPLPEEDEEGNPIVKKPLSDMEIKKEAEAKEALIRSFESNPMIVFLKSALSLGLYYPSLYILNKYPWLVHADEEISVLMLRMFNEMAKPLKEKHALINQADSLILKKDRPGAFVRFSGNNSNNSHNNNNNDNSNVELEPYEISHIDVIKPIKPNHGKKNFTFFFREWNQGLPIIATYEEFFERSNEFLSFLGVKLGLDYSLISYISKFGIQDLKESENDKERYDQKLDKWFLYYKKFILPATTSLHSNPITIHHAYSLFCKFPQEWRYNLYGDLMKNLSKSNKFVKLNYSKAEKATKDMLKRITTQNITPMMRKLAKITYANPLPSFLTLVQQLESYDNLIELIVKAAQYFNDYAWDVLPYALLVRLTIRREARQGDGMNDSLWLQSLSTLIAKFSKTYSKFDVSPILEFAVRSLYDGRSTVGLTLLRDIVLEMGGVQTETNLSSTQIRLKNSGESLVKIVNTVIRDTRDQSADSAKRLLSTLVQSGRLTEFLVLLNDMKVKFIHNSNENSHYKIIANQVDELTAVMHSYIELIGYFLQTDKETFRDNVKPLKELVEDFKLDPIWAFEVWRWDSGFIQEAANVDYFDAEFSHLDKSTYVQFWEKNLYDIFFDLELYEEEINKAKSMVSSLEAQIQTSLRLFRYSKETERERIGLGREKEQYSKLVESIPKDQAKHQEHSSKTVEAVKLSMINCFKDISNPTDDEIESFFQYCIIPRALHSSSDALYAFKFITVFLPFETGVKLFHWFFANEVLDTLLLSFTPTEADNFGFFFGEFYAHFESARREENAADSLKSEIFQWSEITLSSLVTNIINEDYMSRKNTFTFLKNSIHSYPTVEDHADKLVEAITSILATEQRKDIQLAANATLANIQSHSKQWVHIWDYLTFPEDKKKELQDKREAVLIERKRKKLEAQEEARKKADIAAASLRSSKPVSSHQSSRMNTPPVSRGGDLFIPSSAASSKNTPKPSDIPSSSKNIAKTSLEIPSGPKSALSSAPGSAGGKEVVEDKETKISQEPKDVDIKDVDSVEIGKNIQQGSAFESKKQTEETETKAMMAKEKVEPMPAKTQQQSSQKTEVVNQQKKATEVIESKAQSTVKSAPLEDSESTTTTNSTLPSSTRINTPSRSASTTGPAHPLELPSGPKITTRPEARFKNVTASLNENQPNVNSGGSKISIRSNRPLPAQSALNQFGDSAHKGKYGQTNNSFNESRNYQDTGSNNSSFSQRRSSFNSSNSGHSQMSSTSSSSSSYNSNNQSYGSTRHSNSSNYDNGPRGGGHYQNQSYGGQQYSKNGQGRGRGSGGSGGVGGGAPPPPPGPPPMSTNDAKRKASDQGYKGSSKKFKK